MIIFNANVHVMVVVENESNGDDLMILHMLGTAWEYCIFCINE